jgi:hypothetical protein
MLRYGIQMDEVKESDLIRDNDGNFIGMNGRLPQKGETFVINSKKNKIYAGIGNMK